MNAGRRVLGAVLAALALFSVSACGAWSPGKPVCGVDQVAEKDDDGWECEPDVNRNKVDDEDDRADGVVVIPVAPRSTARRSTPSPRRPAVTTSPSPRR